ncbi:hypothetical protein BDW69DRAFT_163319 [Aspergillus filifer]
MDNPTTTVAAATLALSQSNPQSATSTSTPTATEVQMQSQIGSQAQVLASQQTQIPQNTTQQQTQAESHYPHQISGDGGPTATAPFLRDFSLVAEAAKRAQVAIVTRDLEGVSL